MFDIESDGEEGTPVFDLVAGLFLVLLAVFLGANTVLESTVVCRANLTLQTILFICGAIQTITAFVMVVVDLFGWLTKGGKK